MPAESSGPVRTSNSQSRSHKRSSQSSPYKRPPPPKKQTRWPLNWLPNWPFLSRNEERNEEEEDDSEPPEEQEVQSSAPAQKQADTAEEMSELHNDENPTPAQPPQLPPDQLQQGQQRRVNQPDVPLPHQPTQVPVAVNTPQPPQPPAANDLLQFLLGDQRSGTDKIVNFLHAKGDAPLNWFEYTGIMATLSELVQDNGPKPEPFRFSTTASPEPSSSPNINFMTPGTPSNGTPGQGSQRMLSKNPNGTYVYRGGGSSRPRNRFQSPAFGRSRPTPSGIKITPEKPKTDAKRRRMGSDQTTPGQPGPSTARADATPNGATPPSSGPSQTDNVATPNGTSGTNDSSLFSPRPRTAARATTPSRPSPLRQAWGQSESPPQGPRDSPPGPASKPTQAAVFLSGLVKEVTPPKKPDLVNPYQAASPLPSRPATKKPPVRRTRSTASKPNPPAAEQPEKTPSARDIIEATVPKGSKRSRPPPGLRTTRSSAPTPAEANPVPDGDSVKSSQHATSNGVNGTSSAPRSQHRVEIEEVSDEEGGSPPKKQRTEKRRTPPTAPATRATPAAVPTAPPTAPAASTSGPVRPPNGRTHSDTVSVEEIDDVDMSTSQPSSYTLPAEVVEPSESRERSRSTSPTTSSSLANPFTAGAAPGPRSAFGLKSSAPRAPSKLRYSFQAEKEEKEKEVLITKPAPAMPKASAQAPPTQPAPSVPPVSSSKMPESKPTGARDAKTIAMAKSVDELPKYSFTIRTSSPGAGPSSGITFKAKVEAMAVPRSSLPQFDLSAPVKSSTTSSTSTGFNWTAAGIKPPAKPAGNSWTCSVCMLENPATATEKCTVCDTPNPNKSKTTTPSAGGFNWAAAGMKPPTASGGEEWNCKVCMLKNPASAKDKCTVCDAPR